MGGSWIINVGDIYGTWWGPLWMVIYLGGRRGVSILVALKIYYFKLKLNLKF